MERELENLEEVDAEERSFLYCDSTFMTYTPMDHKPALARDDKPMLVDGRQITVAEYFALPDEPGGEPRDVGKMAT